MISRSEYEERLHSMVRSAFAGHVIKRRINSTTWMIKSPNHGFYWQIISVLPSRIVITGDSADMIFRSPYENPIDSLRWFAKSQSDYLLSKCLTHNKVFNIDVALDEVRHVNLEVYEDLDSFMTEYEFNQTLESHDISDFWEYEFGKVAPPDLYHAIAAVERLFSLLEIGEEEPMKAKEEEIRFAKDIAKDPGEGSSPPSPNGGGGDPPEPDPEPEPIPPIPIGPGPDDPDEGTNSLPPRVERLPPRVDRKFTS